MNYKRWIIRSAKVVRIIAWNGYKLSTNLALNLYSQGLLSLNVLGLPDFLILEFIKAQFWKSGAEKDAMFFCRFSDLYVVFYSFALPSGLPLSAYSSCIVHSSSFFPSWKSPSIPVSYSLANWKVLAGIRTKLCGAWYWLIRKTSSFFSLTGHMISDLCMQKM